MEVEPDWVHLGYTENGIAVNSYFVEHPEMMLGHMEYDTRIYGQDSRYTVCVNDDENFNMYAELNKAIRNISAQMTDFERLTEEEEVSADVIPADPDVRNFTYTFFEGKLYYRENSQMIRQEVSANAEERIRQLDEIRNLTRELIDIQMEGCSEEALKSKQELLNAKYDKFVERYGYITGKSNKMAFRDDSDYPLLCSLEEVNEDGEVKKADMFYKQTIKAKPVIERVETAVEALNISINEFGAVNLPYMLYIKVNGVVAPRDSRLKVWYKELETGKTVPIEKTKDMEAIINLILPEDLSGYFFFDTERVQNVAGRKDLSSSVKGLLGLNVLDNAIKHLGKDSTPSTVIGSFYKDLAENDDSKATDALEKIQAAEEKITYQTQVKEEAESEIDHYEERKTALEDKIRSLEDTTELQKRKDNLARNVKQEKDALEKAYSDYKILYGDDAVWFFAQPLYTQAMKFLTEAKVDDKGIKDVTADTIKELIQKGKCLCGAEIKDGNDAYLHLMEQIKFVPPESIGTTINNFKKSIRSFDKVNNNDRYFMTIQTKIGEILRCKNRISEWEDEIKDIEAEIEGKEDAKKYQIELNDVKKRLKEQTSKKENAIAKIAEAESEKSRFKKIYDQLIAKSDKGREIRRYIAYAVKIQEWLQEYYNNEESMIRKQLEDRVNAIFTRMYHGERILQINEKYQSVLYTKIKGSDELIISGESEGLIRVKNFAFIAGLVDLAKEKALRGIPLLVQRYKKIMLELGAHMYIIKTIKGDITKPLGVQAIVNAANSSLLGGGGVDGAIHRAAGPELLFECRLLGGCKTGQAKLTKAYNLPCDYIIHTVGPVWNGGKKNEEELLASCYYNAMQVAMDNEIRTIAFPSISTGIYHFPVELAAKIAVATVARFLSVNEDKFDLVEWVLFDENTEKVYENEVDKIYRDMK